MKISRTAARICAIAAFYVAVQFEIPRTFTSTRSRSLRFKTDNSRLLSDSISMDCTWKDAVPLGADAEVYGTLFASFPGSGMRITWQQTEGITGIQVGDDFHLGGADAYDKSGIIKTQYPHIEGIWSYGGNLDQTILLIRNPRWAIPSYHTLLAEIDYAHDWQTAYEYLFSTFFTRAHVADWKNWRDYRFHEEVNLWVLFIDYYMENGTQYWMDFDYERNGQWPFKFLNDTEKAAHLKDPHCVYDIDCFPKAIISYENLTDPLTGPDEVTKIADALRGKDGMTVVEREKVPCLYHETMTHAPEASNTDRKRGGKLRDEYKFTLEQMNHLVDKLVKTRDKYSKGHWTSNNIAVDLVWHLQTYITETSEEIDEMIKSFAENPPPPTEAPNAQGHQELVKWYTALGRGNRYDKAKVQALAMYWPMVKHMYDEEDPYKDLDLTYLESGPFPRESKRSDIPFNESKIQKYGFNASQYENAGKLPPEIEIQKFYRSHFYKDQ